DRSLGDELLSKVLLETPLDERRATVLAPVNYCRETSQPARAEQLLRGLLDDPKEGKDSSFWRLGAELAAGQGGPASQVPYLEKALELEFTQPTKQTALEKVRAEYAELLDHYQGLSRSLAAAQVKPNEEYLARIMGAADRWRTLDPDADAACHAAARALTAAGARELAWDYLTTPISLH